MVAINDVTGDVLRSRLLSPEGKANLSRVVDTYFVFLVSEGNDEEGDLTKYKDQLNESPLSYFEARRLARQSVDVIKNEHEGLVICKKEGDWFTPKEYMTKSMTFMNLPDVVKSNGV